MAGWIKRPDWYGGSLGPGDFLLNGDTAPPSTKKWGRAPHPPQFSAHIYCGQTAGWIKMALRMEVGLGPGHNVLDGDPPPKGGTVLQFSAHVYCGQTAGMLDRSRCHLAGR